MALNSKQKAAAEVLVSEPDKGYYEVASLLGVDYSTLRRWRNKPEFQEYEHELCQKRFKSLERLAIQKLKENTDKNNQRAIEYILEGCGYKAKEEITVNDGNINITIVDDANE